MSRMANTSDLIHDKIAHSYGFDTNRLYSAWLKIQILTKNLRPQTRVLDVGCANGLFAFTAAKVAAHVDALDLNEQMIAIAREKQSQTGVDNISFHQGDAQALPFPSAWYDLVYSFSTILLVPNAEKAIAEAVRVLKPGGALILDLTGRYNLVHPFWKKWYRESGHPHFSCYSRQDLHLIAERYGLEIVDMQSLGFLDQWKYLPVIKRYAHRLGFIDGLIHPSKSFDLDHLVTSLPGVNRLASRWYVTFRKKV